MIQVRSFDELKPYLAQMDSVTQVYFLGVPAAYCEIKVYRHYASSYRELEVRYERTTDGKTKRALAHWRFHPNVSRDVFMYELGRTVQLATSIGER